MFIKKKKKIPPAIIYDRDSLRVVKGNIGSRVEMHAHFF